MAFINTTRLPSKNWSQHQLDVATSMTRDSEVVDLPAPRVSGIRNKEYIISVAYEVSGTIEQMLPAIDHKLDGIIVAGEPTLTFRLVNQLRSDFPGVPIVADCFDEVTGEFIQFREYV